MRNTIISSSIASVVSRVIDSIAVAGSAVRTILRLTFMRERAGYWLEPCQPEFALACNHLGYQLGKLKPGIKPGHLGQFGILAHAAYPAASRLASVRANRQG